MTEKEKADIEKLKILTGESDEKLLSLLLAEARDFVKAYTNRSIVPQQLEGTVRELAVIALNRMGTEGESGRSDGGESYTFETAPRKVYDIMNRYRLARAGGKTYENKTEQA